MKLSNKEREAVYRYNIDCTEKEKADLKRLAIERFAKDEKAQIEYATRLILQDAVEENPEVAIPLLLDIIESETNTRLAEKTEEKKNGNKNNDRQ